MLKRLLILSLAIGTACSGQSTPAQPQVAAGANAATVGKANLTPTPPPFTITNVGQFRQPFALAFLPDGRLLVTEKGGTLRLRATDGTVTAVGGVPAVATGGQGGLLDVALAPDFARSRRIYLSFSEPGTGGRGLALARGTLDTAGSPMLKDVAVLWRGGSNGTGTGHFGGSIMFSPDGRHLFLSAGERQRGTPAQDQEQLVGKILRLTPDGKAAPGNPMFSAGGPRAMIWSMGHRNPYGLAFTPDGKLWEEEMGPLGGDELNLILPGKNYGWPLVSNGDEYNRNPIPDHPNRPEMEAPKAWWNPSISPGGMVHYSGAMFPAYRGSLLIGALSGMALIRVVVKGDTARATDQWNMGMRIRDVAQAPDGAIWVLEDGDRGGAGKLMRLTPK